MASVGNQNPWTPFNTYRDCSQGICSIYCPQWCYIVYPPPPPLDLGDDDSGPDFSPLIIAVIGVIASAFILVSYYTIISKYCWRRRHGDGSIELSENHDQIGNNESWQGAAGGLDEALIKSITVFKYQKGEGFIDGTDCSVCLSEFQESESLRLLPKCNHAFHLPCIDAWLKSHASCPLCRSNIFASSTISHQAPSPAVLQEHSRSTTNVNVSSALEYQHRISDTVLVFQEDLEGNVQEEAVVSLVVGDDPMPKTPIQDLEGVLQENRNMTGARQGQIQEMRRSASLNFHARQGQFMIADILSISDDDDEDDDGEYQIREIEKHRNGVLNLIRSPLALKRSFSTGRFMFTRYEKGRSSIVPN